MKLIVLLSTYNGEKYLREQLDSLISQEFRPYKIFIRDDGSNDDTLKILEEYRRKYLFIEYYQGENLGPAKSFFDLIRRCKKADYYALCDQDDVWFRDKLKTAVEMLDSENQELPLLYCSRFTLTDKDLHPINSDVSRLYDYTDFAHSLIYHTAPGCTFVFNNKARDVVLKYDLDKQYYLIHDAIIHKVVLLYGKMILDKSSHMYYRQHGDNEIGMSANKFKSFFGRVNRFLNGKIKNYRSRTARSLLEVYGDDCEPEKKELMQMVAYYTKDKLLKKKLLNAECFMTNTFNDLFFKLLVLMNYI